MKLTARGGHIWVPRFAKTPAPDEWLPPPSIPSAALAAEP
jgi:hypothetical protein